MNRINQENTQISVLVLDDEENIREPLIDYLEDCNFHVIAAESGDLALKLLTQFAVDIGIIDIRLPIMDGFQFMVEASKLQPQMQFIIYSASMNTKLQPLLLVEQQVPIFQKPIEDMSLLVSAIHELITKQEVYVP